MRHPLGQDAWERIQSRRHMLETFQQLADDEEDELTAPLLLTPPSNVGRAESSFRHRQSDHNLSVTGVASPPVRTLWEAVMSTHMTVVKNSEVLSDDDDRSTPVHGKGSHVSSENRIENTKLISIPEIRATDSERHTSSESERSLDELSHDSSTTTPCNVVDIIDLTEDSNVIQRSSIERDSWCSRYLITRGKCTFLDNLSVRDNDTLAAYFAKEDDELVARLADSNVPLLGSSFKRLQGQRWLDDEIINGFAGMINNRSEEVENSIGATATNSIPKTRMFVSFFFQKMCPARKKFDYGAVRKWTSRARWSVLNLDLILIPIHLTRNHWALATVDTQYKEFGYLDPLYQYDRFDVLPSLKKWFQAELEDKEGKPLADKYRVFGWEERVNSYRVRRSGVLPPRLLHSGAEQHDVLHIPVQEDATSCGVFAIKIADCLSMGHAVYFDQTHIPLLRKKVALDLVRTYLPF